MRKALTIVAFLVFVAGISQADRLTSRTSRNIESETDDVAFMVKTSAGDKAASLKLETGDQKYALRVAALSNNLVVRDATAGQARITVKSSGEVEVHSVSGDGTGKVVCVRGNGNLGTCSDQPGAGGTCTCG